MNGIPSRQEDERANILRMIEEGKISASEGITLLNSLGQMRQPDLVDNTSPMGKQRWFRVLVTDLNSGKAKATVNIPLSLMEWGMKIGSHYSSEISEFNLQEMADLLHSGADGKIVDVLDEEDGEHVEVFVE